MTGNEMLDALDARITDVDQRATHTNEVVEKLALIVQEQQAINESINERLRLIHERIDVVWRAVGVLSGDQS